MSSYLKERLYGVNLVLAKNSWRLYRSMIYRLCREYSDFEHSSAIRDLLRKNDIYSLVTYADDMVEQKYSTAKETFLASQFAALIRKYPYPTDIVSFEPLKAAVECFENSEQKCSEFNSKPSSYFAGTNFSSFESMRRFISYVLGPFDLKSILDECDITHGASIGVHGNATNLMRKLASDWTVSHCARDYAYAAISRNPYLSLTLLEKRNGYYCYDYSNVKQTFDSMVRCVSHNKIAFVPKTAKTFRSIAVEPFLNSFLQKGVDVVLRRKLHRIGIDLSDQSYNSQLAREGSILKFGGQSFSTIDLSSASDSISIRLCKELLPPEWFEFLNSIRSPSFSYNGTVKRYSKFCSMGNGFCFPLQTLLFAAACSSLGLIPRDDFSVYGDDIAVRGEVTSLILVSLLNDMGFTVNKRKTFTKGPFRESCGSDWYDGVDIRPTFLDYELDSVESIFKFLNSTRRSSLTGMFFCGIWSLLLDQVPHLLRFFRPCEGNADSGLTVPFDMFLSSPHARWNKNLQAWSWKEIVSKPVADKASGLRFRDLSLEVACLRGASSANPFVMRRKTHKTIRNISYSPGRVVSHPLDAA